MKKKVQIKERWVIVEQSWDGTKRSLRHEYESLEEATEAARKLNKNPMSQTSFFVRDAIAED
jgi:hypothetical protein